ncbi:hypothetical protein M569_14932 [Genlisea aurea]|uniref:Uncharacterized protein n=1 Tax=Genlisea aurea TaxID=192259 RepID=S8DB18_9LAMI|nr:hypothetical protein M569_14932 [Genlisea aurea]
MSLVDYAASSDEDDDSADEANNAPPVKEISEERRPEPSQPSAVPYETSGQGKPGRVSLPDASVLLNSSPSDPPPNRKRGEVTESRYLPHRKIPKKDATVSSAGHILLPPQLTGRSNVVTEDISKLFVTKRVE